MTRKNIINLFILVSATLIFIGCSKQDCPEEKGFTPAKEAKLDSIFAAAMTSYEIPGAIVGIWSPEGTYVKTKGLSDLATMEPMNVNNHFRIGSLTKTFTGTIVLKLVEEGKINLDESMAHYLPQYKFPEADKITVRMLGNMTSGIFDCTRDQQWIEHNRATNWETVYTADSMVKIALPYPLNFEPGTKYNYTNTTPLILGLICESVTGKTMKQLLVEKIFEPYHLDQTIWPDNRYLPAPYSHGYSKENSTREFKDMSLMNPSFAGASGNLISNVYDLKKWIRLLGTGALYSTASHQERLNWSSVSQNAYGFALENLFGVADPEGFVLGHSGAIWGYNTMAYYIPSVDMAIVVHVNYYSRGEKLPASSLLMDMITVALD
ncbi:MAG: serine hydrolase domain-containing protein [Bacteroidales bacterium]